MGVKSLSERFYENVSTVPEAGCWIWIGSLRHGYGAMHVNGYSHGAHRVSWEMHKGSIPPKSYVLHKCDTPACVNPDHLFLGDQFDNMADMKRKGRGPKHQRAFGDRQGSAVLTNDQALEIFMDNRPSRVVAKEYGTNKTTVLNIRNGRQWSKITGKECTNARR